MSNDNTLVWKWLQICKYSTCFSLGGIPPLLINIFNQCKKDKFKTKYNCMFMIQVIIKVFSQSDKGSQEASKTETFVKRATLHTPLILSI